MTSDELYGVFVSELGALSLAMVRDDEIYRYMNEAFRTFARLTGGIADSTSDAATLDMTPGEGDVTIHPSVLRIMRATRASDNHPITIINETDLDQKRHNSFDYGHLATVSLDSRQGPVNYLMIGQQKNLGRWINVPAVADTANLMVYRLPLTKITQAGQSLNEIEEQHHFPLLDYMKSLAYKRPGTPFFNPKMAVEFDTAFREYCGRVKAEVERYKQKTRVVAYGGL